MFSDNELLLLYASKGPVERLEKIMGVRNFSGFMLQSALDVAAEHGNVEAVKVLMTVCSVHGSSALWEACYHGHAGVIDVLLQNGFCADGAIGDCMEYKNFECFTIVAGHSDPDDFCDAFVRSFIIEDNDTAEIGRTLLMEHCHAEMLLRKLSVDHPKHTKAHDWVQQIVAHEQNARIGEQVLSCGVHRTHSKI